MNSAANQFNPIRIRNKPDATKHMFREPPDEMYMLSLVSVMPLETCPEETV